MNEIHATQAPDRPRTWKAVYTIIDRGTEKKYWIRIGIAFVNSDGSINVKLDAVPVNNQLHIRDPDPVNTASRRGASDMFAGAEALS